MTDLIKWDPFAELSALQRQFFGDDWFSSFKGVNVPTTDIYTKGNTLQIEAHLPNFEEKDVNVQVEGGALVISAERREKEEDKDKKYVVRESSSSFYRRVALPERANTDATQAKFENGVLEVSIPLQQLPEPKRITLGSGSEKEKK